MRSILTSMLILLCCISVRAQEIPVDKDTGKITFKEVVEVPGTKNQLFNRCISWINKEYKDPTRITTLRDQATGKIKGKHQFRLFYQDDEGNRKDGGMVLYQFTIELKEGRYRYILTDFVLKKSSKFPIENWLDKDAVDYNPQMEKYLVQIDEFVQAWAERLNSGMQPEKAIKDDSDW